VERSSSPPFSAHAAHEACSSDLRADATQARFVRICCRRDGRWSLLNYTSQYAQLTDRQFELLGRIWLNGRTSNSPWVACSIVSCTPQSSWGEL
jgi:hypothetical protein